MHEHGHGDLLFVHGRIRIGTRFLSRLATQQHQLFHVAKRSHGTRLGGGRFRRFSRGLFFGGFIGLVFTALGHRVVGPIDHEVHFLELMSVLGPLPHFQRVDAIGGFNDCNVPAFVIEFLDGHRAASTRPVGGDGSGQMGVGVHPVVFGVEPVIIPPTVLL